MHTDPPLVVVIEDHDDSRELLEASLTIEGFRVQGSRTAEEALVHIAGGTPAAVLTDLSLPGMTGEELALRLRGDPALSAVPVIALSGRLLDAKVAHVFDDVVMKPVDLRALSSKLKGIIERARTPRGRVDDPDGSVGLAQTQGGAGPALERAAPRAQLSSDQYRLLVEHAPTMLWRAGPDGSCNWFNEVWLEYTGRSMAEEVGDGWTKSVHPEDAARCVQTYLAHLKRREPFEIEYRLRRHDGEYRWTLDRGVPFFDDHGEFGGFIGSCLDIEDRRQAERSKTQFLTLMAHELRTPLTPLRAYVHQLERQAERNQPVESELVARLARQVDRIVALAENLSDTARLDADTAIAIEREEVDVRTLVRRVVNEQLDALERAPASRIRPQIIVEEGASPVKLLVDSRRLMQAFRHVLDNAVKFSPRGGTVDIRISQELESVQIVTSDEGIGIPAGELGRVGTKYFRASNVPTANFSGVGLGLALSNEIMRAHGGELSVVSSGARAGSTVTLIWPRAAGTA